MFYRLPGYRLCHTNVDETFPPDQPARSSRRKSINPSEQGMLSCRVFPDIPNESADTVFPRPVYTASVSLVEVNLAFHSGQPSSS